jgi:hypothetical protein
METQRMSRILIPDDKLPEALSLLSAERLSIYTNITGDVRSAIELHDLVLQTSAALMPVVAMIEIALRNAICDRLGAHFRTVDWLQNPPHPFVWRGEEIDALRRSRRHVQQAGYARRNQHQKRQLDKLAFPQGVPEGLSHLDRVRARRQHIQITFGQLVAQLTLGFWKRLFSADYDASLWDRSLKRLFPDIGFTRANVAKNLEFIYQARNRAAHHEPVFGSKLVQLLASIDIFVSNFGPILDGGMTLLAIMTEANRKELKMKADALGDAIASFNVVAIDEP